MNGGLASIPFAALLASWSSNWEHAFSVVFTLGADQACILANIYFCCIESHITHATGEKVQ